MPLPRVCACTHAQIVLRKTQLSLARKQTARMRQTRSLWSPPSRTLITITGRQGRYQLKKWADSCFRGILIRGVAAGGGSHNFFGQRTLRSARAANQHAQATAREPQTVSQSSRSWPLTVRASAVRLAPKGFWRGALPLYWPPALRGHCEPEAPPRAGLKIHLPENDP